MNPQQGEKMGNFESGNDRFMPVAPIFATIANVGATTAAEAQPAIPATETLQDQAWLEVIRKMDEVYQDLIAQEVALEEKNAALEAQQQLLRSVLASMSELLLVCDREGYIQIINQALLDFTGRSETEWIGQHFLELFPPGPARQTALQRLAAHSATTVADCELEILNAHGEAVPVSFNCRPRYDARGLWLGRVITGRPLGELRRAFAALQQAHEDLKRTQQQLLQAEKMASLGRLVAGVAHELNNPISFVLGNVYALRRYLERLQNYLNSLERYVPDSTVQPLREKWRISRVLSDLPSLIAGMLEGAERTRDIVDSLKRFSAPDQSAHELLDLREVIARAVHWVSKSAPERFRVTIELPEPLPVMGSAGQLQQVVMNLVQNAADATMSQPSSELQITAQIEQQHVVVRFRDNGPGIAPEHLAHVFEPFFTTKPVGQGTGLGLSISYGLVQKHGGRLEVNNPAAGGAEFLLILPLANGSGANPMPPSIDLPS